MKSTIAFAAICTLVSTPLAAQSIDGKAYLISLLSPAPDVEINTYFDETSALIENQGGAYVVPPIHVEKELHNPYLPDVYSEFPSDYVTITRFETPSALQSFLKTAEKHFAIWDDQLATKIRFKAGIIPAPNTDQKLPVIGEVPPRKGDSFILLNASSFKALPETPAYIQKYGSEIGVVTGAGTLFHATFAKQGDVTGTYDYQILFLSEWESEEAFESVHSNEAWRMVVPFRNFALSGFTEAKGVIGGE